jgi:hypothetical protein
LYNENQQLNFDPYGLENEMMAEYIGTTKDDFFLSMVMYEEQPQKLYFEIEMH